MMLALHLVAVFALALLLGGMVFFAGVVAPKVFTRLPMAQAGPFIRALFPQYYRYLAATSAVCAAALAVERPLDAAVMALMVAVTLWLLLGLMPAINRRSDLAQAGTAGAKQAFDRGHRLSVIVNAAQLVVAAGVFIHLTA